MNFDGTGQSVVLSNLVEPRGFDVLGLNIVPEPSTFGMTMLGLAALGLRRKR